MSRIFGHPIITKYELNKDGSYSILSLVEKEGKKYCVGYTNFRSMGAAPGNQWEIITDDEDYSPTVASTFIKTENQLFTPNFEHLLGECIFSSYEEMKNYWDENSIQIGDRRTGQGVEAVFTLP